MKSIRLNALLILSFLFFCSCAKDLTDQDIQQRLDNGETPLEIYDDNEVSVVQFHGLTYAGGIIIEFFGNGSGLLVSAEDLGSYPWGCNGINVNPDSSFDLECMIGSATAACNSYLYDGYNDWFLPSVHQLSLSERNAVIPNFVGQYWTNTDSITLFGVGVDSLTAIALYVNQPNNCNQPDGDLFGSNAFFTRCDELVNRTNLLQVRAFRKF